MTEQTFEAELAAWHSRRLEALTAPDGWLAVTGLLWVEPDEWRFGSAPDNDFVIEKLPAHAGAIRLEADGRALVLLNEGAGGTIDGHSTRQAALTDDGNPKIAPTRVAFGPVSFHLIDREGKKALRVRDSESDIRRDFTGIDRFPAAPALRFEAHWLPVEPPRSFMVDSVVGIASEIAVKRKATFTHEGRDYTLWPTHGGETAPMFVFRDLTSGEETYGAGRFLFGSFSPDKPDTIVLDFNRAINPPCAFTPAATCPLPPEENRLPFAVCAGERKPR